MSDWGNPSAGDKVVEHKHKTCGSLCSMMVTLRCHCMDVRRRIRVRTVVWQSGQAEQRFAFGFAGIWICTICQCWRRYILKAVEKAIEVTLICDQGRMASTSIHDLELMICRMQYLDNRFAIDFNTECKPGIMIQQCKQAIRQANTTSPIRCYHEEWILFLRQPELRSGQASCQR